MKSEEQEELKKEIDSLNDYENDHSPRKKKKKKISKNKQNNLEIKSEPFDYYENQEDFDSYESADLALSEDFIILILQQIDDVCENIKNGDPDIHRTLKVSKKLNDAVDCYRNRLEPPKPNIDASEYLETYDFMDNNGLYL